MKKLLALLLASFFFLSACSGNSGDNSGQGGGKEAARPGLAPLPLEENSLHREAPPRDKFTLARPILQSLKEFLNR